MTSPWPGIVPGVDVSRAAVADLKMAKGGDDLADELERPRHRRWTSWVRLRRVGRAEWERLQAAHSNARPPA